MFFILSRKILFPLIQICSSFKKKKAKKLQRAFHNEEGIILWWTKGELTSASCRILQTHGGPEGGCAVVVLLGMGLPLDAACNNLTEQM